jgi:D-alanyl-D-alanine carboxypeptidase
VSIAERQGWSHARALGHALIALALIAGPVLTTADAAMAAKKKTTTPSIAAAIVVDMNSGSILQEQAADMPRHPASLTKMMTLYVLFGYLKAGKLTPSSDLTVTEHAATQAPTKLGLKPGATIKVNHAVKALVTQSANDAAVTVAENLAGTEENFAKLMTDTARQIGMRNTLFRNASGLPNDEHITTARDMASLSAHLIHDYPDYYTGFSTQYFTFNGRRYRNHNKLLLNYKGTDGIKTGYTRASGYNLAASVHRGEKHLIAIVLGGKTGSQRDAAMRALLEKNFVAASTTKPTAAQLVASLVTPAPLPAMKKPAYAMASVTPAPAAATPVVTPAEGDISEPALPLRASLTSSDPLPKPSARKVQYDGAYHVQVGAYMSQDEAENRLGMVQQRAMALLDGHLPFTASFMKGDQEWYRARFAGFSKPDAQAACAALKKMSLDCVVMSAE